MNETVKSVIQGVVEGITEFLPVSSTAHIRIAQELMGVDRELPYWKMFAVVIQLGAILSVVVFFRSRIWEFFLSFRQAIGPKQTTQNLSEDPSVPGSRERRSWMAHPLVFVLVSFVVTAIPCFLIDKLIDKNLESPTLIACALFVGAIAMVVVDWLCHAKAKTHRMEDMTMGQAIAIGLFQILAAAFPGTSRSMATIVGGQVFGLSRSAALEFSFFLAIPVMTAAAGYKLLSHILKNALPTTEEWVNLGVGFVVSFVVAYAVIAWFMNWVRSRGFVPFAVYRVILAVVMLWILHG